MPKPPGSEQDRAGLGSNKRHAGQTIVLHVWRRSSVATGSKKTFSHRSSWGKWRYNSTDTFSVGTQTYQYIHLIRYLLNGGAFLFNLTEEKEEEKICVTNIILHVINNFTCAVSDRWKKYKGNSKKECLFHCFFEYHNFSDYDDPLLNIPESNPHVSLGNHHKDKWHLWVKQCLA